MPKYRWALVNCQCLWEYNGSNRLRETTHIVSDSNKEKEESPLQFSRLRFFRDQQEKMLYLRNEMVQAK